MVAYESRLKLLEELDSLSDEIKAKPRYKALRRKAENSPDGSPENKKVYTTCEKLYSIGGVGQTQIPVVQTATPSVEEPAKPVAPTPAVESAPAKPVAPKPEVDAGKTILQAYGDKIADLRRECNPNGFYEATSKKHPNYLKFEHYKKGVASIRSDLSQSVPKLSPLSLEAEAYKRTLENKLNKCDREVQDNDKNAFALWARNLRKENLKNVGWKYRKQIGGAVVGGAAVALLLWNLGIGGGKPENYGIVGVHGDQPNSPVTVWNAEPHLYTSKSNKFTLQQIINDKGDNVLAKVDIEGRPAVIGQEITLQEHLNDVDIYPLQGETAIDLTLEVAEAPPTPKPTATKVPSSGGYIPPKPTKKPTKKPTAVPTIEPSPEPTATPKPTAVPPKDEFDFSGPKDVNLFDPTKK